MRADSPGGSGGKRRTIAEFAALMLAVYWATGRAYTRGYREGSVHTLGNVLKGAAQARRRELD